MLCWLLARGGYLLLIKLCTLSVQNCKQILRFVNAMHGELFLRRHLGLTWLGDIEFTKVQRQEVRTEFEFRRRADAHPTRNGSDDTPPTCIMAADSSNRNAETFEEIIRLERIDVNLFRGHTPKSSYLPRIYGGQTIAQALRAAGFTVDPAFVVHSLHASFYLPGDPTVPILYYVDRTRDGRSFISRRVVAMQKGESIFSAAISFQKPEAGGVEHQDEMPEAKLPKHLPTHDQILAALRADPRLPKNSGEIFNRIIELPVPVEVRRVTDPFCVDAMAGAKRKPRELSWMRVRGLINSADPFIHACALAFMVRCLSLCGYVHSRSQSVASRIRFCCEFKSFFTKRNRPMLPRFLSERLGHSRSRKAAARSQRVAPGPIQSRVTRSHHVVSRFVSRRRVASRRRQLDARHRRSRPRFQQILYQIGQAGRVVRAGGRHASHAPEAGVDTIVATTVFESGRQTFTARGKDRGARIAYVLRDRSIVKQEQTLSHIQNTREILPYDCVDFFILMRWQLQQYGRLLNRKTLKDNAHGARPRQ